MTDTVRTIDELLNSIFASGQAAKSINEQDVRDALVSISLETTDLSSLPRSPAGLAVGRLWIDSTTALRIVTGASPSNVIAFQAIFGSGGLLANPQILGHTVVSASALLQGVGSRTFSGTIDSTGAFSMAFSDAFDRGTPTIGGSVLAAATFAGGGAAIITATPVRRIAGALLAAAAGSLAAPSTSSGGSFSSAFSSAYQKGGSIPVTQTASATLPGLAGLVPPNPTRIGQMLWASGAHVTLQNGSLRWRSAFASGDPTWVATTGTAFKTSGKWYVELFFPLRNDDMRYGIANPSFNAANYLGVDQNSWGVIDNFDGTGTDLYNGVSTYVGTVAPPGENGIVSLAIDCDNWKWWTRINGGAWSVLAGGTQNPATNQGGMAIPVNLRTGGVSVAGAMNFGTDDYMDMFPTSSGNGPFSVAFSSAFSKTGGAGGWSYTPPAGFVAM